MSFKSFIEENANLVTGTNCSNCKFTKGSKGQPLEDGDLNAQGGLNIADKDKKNAKEGDLITLPGKGKTPDAKYWCKNKDIKQFVTGRMCCAYWDAVGCIRDF